MHLNLGPAVAIASDDFESVSGVSTFTCSSAHGLVIGSPFRIIDSSNNKLVTLQSKRELVLIHSLQKQMQI